MINLKLKNTTVPEHFHNRRDSCRINTSNTHVLQSLSWFDTGAPIKYGGVIFKLVIRRKVKQRSIKHTYKTKDRVTRIILKTEDVLRCSGMVSSSCSTSGTRCVNLVINRVISIFHMWVKCRFLNYVHRNWYLYNIFLFAV
jgi:hypothetical protein